MAFRLKSLRFGATTKCLYDGQPSFIYPPHLSDEGIRETK